MRVGVTGSAGLLGRTLVPLWRAAGAEVLAWTRTDFDVSDPQAVQRVVGATKPDVIVHAAAWTDVDGAEKAPERVEAVNVVSTATIATTANGVRATMIYVSTDYVFGGTERAPISPDARTAPRGVYARSKAAGEEAVQSVADTWMIVRTGWAYGPGGRNFVDTMRKAAAEGRAVRVVNDQVGAPTSVRLVAEALWGLVASRHRGTWHVAAAGETSWYGVARAIYEAAGADPALVTPCTSRELDRPAPRPAWSVLDCQATVTALGAPMPPWDEQVRAYVRSGALPACGLLEAAA